MKKTKGLSFEEKRKRMSDIFKDDPSFFHLKDIEKLGTKKGIIFQTIKDVLDSLVNDNLVETDKIGSSNFYWALPSKIYQVKKNGLDRNYEAIENINADNEALKNKIKEAKALRKETDERREKLDELEELMRKKQEYEKKLLEYKKNDPERYKNVLADTKQLVILNELWKDNIYCIDQWMRSKNPDVKIVEMFPDLEPLNLFD
jgi:predicted RNase H-like nuclease (RuvC/YqgF family)